MTIHRVFWPCVLLLASSLALAVSAGAVGQRAAPPARAAKDVPPPPPPRRQFEEPRAATFLAKASEFIRVGEARSQFNVSGDGLTVAVIDTGLRVTHQDFTGRVPVQRNFVTEDGGKADDANDQEGHGTHVTGIVAAGGLHTGMAPKARVIPLRVFDETGASWADIAQALQWVLANHQKYRIGVVNMSLGDRGGSWQDDSKFANDAAKAQVKGLLRDLRQKRVAVVVAAGNAYFTTGSKQGMGFPAICREVISVGAVYDGNWGKQTYADGAEATRTARDQLTPFSQRLLPTNLGFRTTVFAPGAPILSSGIKSDRGESLDSGTSQACPVVAGVVLLMQQYYRRESPHRQLPSVDDLETWLRGSSVSIPDPAKTKGPDGELTAYDNVKHTDGTFLRLDALDALAAVNRVVQGELRQVRTRSGGEDPELLKLRQTVRQLQAEK